MDQYTFSVRRPKLEAVGTITIFLLESLPASGSPSAVEIVFLPDGTSVLSVGSVSFCGLSAFAQVFGALSAAKSLSQAILREILTDAGFAERISVRETISVETSAKEVSIWLPAGLADELRELAPPTSDSRLLSALRAPDDEEEGYTVEGRKGFAFRLNSRPLREFVSLLRKAGRVSLERERDWQWVVEAELAVRLLTEPKSATLLCGAAKKGA